MSESHSLAQLRAELARAAMAAKRTPCAETRATLDRLRGEYAEAKLADYVAKVVAAAPPLTDAQRTRLALLLKRGDGEPPGGQGADSIRREHESRDGGSATPESLTRDAHRLLDACGVARSPKWVQRVVRDYCSASASGLPFGMYLANRVELNAQQRQAVLDRSDLRYLLEYADPTGETAVRQVLREKSTDLGGESA